MQIYVELLCRGDVWTFVIARDHVFSRTKWLPSTMWRTSFVRRVRSSPVLRSNASCIVKGADRIVVAASMLLITVVVDASVVTCKVVSADRNGATVSR